MMMGHCSFGHGGSSPSSSSNLSALAPPFSVDRSVPKSISSPLVDLTETTYGVSFNPSLRNWLGSQPPTSRPDYFSSSNLELNSANAYRYSSSTEHVAPLNPHVSASTDTGLYGQSSNGFIEAQPYYPSYVSNAIGIGSPLDIPHNSGYDLLSTCHVATSNGSSPEDYTQSLSELEHSAHWTGLWEGPTNWQQSQRVQLDGRFCSNENFMNQGLYAFEGMGKFKEASHSIDAVGIEKQTVSGGMEQLDFNSFLGEYPDFKPSVYPTSTSSASTLPVPETCPPVPSLKPVNSWNNQIPYGASYEKCLRKHDATPSDMASINNSSPKIVIRSPAQDTSSHRNTNSTSNGENKAFPGYNPSVVMEPYLFTGSNLNTTSDGDNKAFSSNNPSAIMEPDPFMSSKGSACYHASQVSFHLEQNEQVNSGFSLEKNEELSRNERTSVDAFDQFSGKKSRIQVPRATIDGFNLVGDRDEGINSVKNHSDNLDHYNPAVDSPCWKGAPVTHFSQFEVSEVLTPVTHFSQFEVSEALTPVTHFSQFEVSEVLTPVAHFSQFEVSEVLTPQNNKKLEAHSDSNLQVHQFFTLSSNDAVKVSPEKASKNLFGQNSWSKAPSPKTPMVDNILLKEGIDAAVNVGPAHTKPICSDGVEITNDSLPKKSFSNSGNKLPHDEQQSCEGDKWTSKKNCSVGIGLTEVGKNVKDDPDDCSSHVPFHAIECVLHSSSSADGSPSKLIESYGKEPTQKIYVRTLIDTMQNLSELLVFHLLNDVCELKNDDYQVLKDVTNNLDLCMFKNVERMTESATAQFIGNSSKLQKDRNGNASQVSRIHPLNVQASVKYQHVQEEDHNNVSDKNNEKSSNFVSAMAPAGILKDDKITQALKKALIENFHVEEEIEPRVLLYKNLWLEAEASLCSASCIARFNRIKREMENCNSQNTNENSVVMEKLSSSKVSFDLPASNMLASDAKGSPLPDASTPESPILSSSSHANDVAARFHILKNRIDGSSTENTSYPDPDNTLGSAEKLSSSEGSPIPNSVDKLAFEENVAGQKLEMSIQDAPMSSLPRHADDVEGSVVARFHILTPWVNSLTSMDRKEHQVANVDLEFGGLQRQSPTGIDRSEDKVLDVVNLEPNPRSYPFDSSEDKLAVKEFHLFVKDDTKIQSRLGSKPGDQSHAAVCDGSSDWEHVLLEELAGRSC